MFPKEYIDQLSQLPDAQQEQGLGLVPGDDLPKSLWESLVNLRLETEGMYKLWKLRGGTVEKKTVFGQIVSLYGFRARIDSLQKSLIAIHNSAGEVHLWNITDNTVTEIMTSFPTDEQIQLAHNGRFLYGFSYDGGTAKYYDLDADVAFDFMSYKKAYLWAVNYLHEPVENVPQNILGLEAGQKIIVFPNGTGLPGYESYETIIETIEDSSDNTIFVTFQDPKGNNATAPVGGVGESQVDDTNIVFPSSEATEDLLGQPANKETDGAGGTQFNDKYSPPVIYRQYVLIDQMNDGSIGIAGKPFQVQAGARQILQDGLTNITLTATAASPHAAKRYLCATRWHASNEGAFIPSSPLHANSPLFVIREVDPKDLFIQDNTPDSRLLRPVLEIYPVTAGIADLFGPGEIIPNSVAAFKGSLLLGGYMINRPVPAPYSDPNAATVENVFTDIVQTTRLPNNMALAFQFEYTDGKKSKIVETEEFLQNGSTTGTEPVACDQTRAAGAHMIITGAQQDGKLLVTYQGITVEVPLTVATHNSPAEVAEAIRQTVNANSTIRLTADVPSADVVKYIEKRWGEGFNGNIVDVEAGKSAEGAIDVQANNISQVVGDKAGGSITITSPPDSSKQAAPATAVMTVSGVSGTEDFRLRLDIGEDFIFTGTIAGGSTTDQVAAVIASTIESHADWKTTRSGSDINIEAEQVGTTFNAVSFSTISFEPGSTTQLSSGGGATTTSPISAGGQDSTIDNYIINLDGEQIAVNVDYPVDTVNEVAQAVYDAINTQSGIYDATAINADTVTITAKQTGQDQKGDITTTPGNTAITHTDTELSGGTDDTTGSENHTISIDGVASAAITVLGSDTLEDIAGKYVAGINGDAILSADYSAEKVNNGDGTWRCLITVIARGLAGNNKVVAVNNVTEVTFVTTDTAGGIEDPGVTFDVEDPSLSGAKEPEGTRAQGFLAATSNNQSHDGDGIAIYTTFNGESNDPAQDAEIMPDDSLNVIASAILNQLNSISGFIDNWTAVLDEFTIGDITYPGVRLTAKNPGPAWNDIAFETRPRIELGVTVRHSAPGSAWSVLGSSTAGGAETCKQATASIDVTANNLGAGATEDHTLTIDGTSTAPITITDGDTEEQIVDKYIAEIQKTLSIDLDWKATKEAIAGGWRLLLSYRLYGSVGNDKVVSITGAANVTVVANSPSSGGSDAGDVPAPQPAEQVNANRVQIHSLNALVSKVFILGRVNDGAKRFHLIKEFGITDPQAHGMVVDLPNTEEALNEIEAEVYPIPATEDVLETVALENYIVIGTPFQRFSISGQKAITDQSKINNVVTAGFDVDKTLMRYRVLLFTENNIQVGYIVSSGGVFDADFEINQHGMIATGYKGITTIGENTFFTTKHGLHVWTKGTVQKLIDRKRYSVLENNDIRNVIYNQRHNEYWFICEANEAVVLDADSGLFRRMRYEGTDMGTLRAGLAFEDDFYIAINGKLCATDIAGTFDDIGQGAAHGEYINGVARTGHIGSPTVQRKMLDMQVYGQTYICTLSVDTQPARFIGDPAVWSKDFNGEINAGTKTLEMEGMIYPIQTRMKLGRIQLEMTTTAEGFMESAELRSIPLADKGMAQKE